MVSMESDEFMVYMISRMYAVWRYGSNDVMEYGVVVSDGFIVCTRCCNT